MKTLLVALAAIAVSIFGVAAQDSGLTQAEAPSLEGSNWHLVSLTEEGATTPTEGEITLAFNSGQQFNGNGGCNTYSGTYEAAPDGITFSDVASTRMACADERLTAQESQYFMALSAVITYQFSGNRLTLSTADGRVLTFAPHGAYALIGSAWELAAYGSVSAETTVTGTDLPTLEFVSATELSAFGGCNGSGSTYPAADDGTMTIEQGVGTLIACEPDVMAQETAYFTLLPSVVGYEISGGWLTLYTDDDQFLRFTATGEYALTRATWQLSEIIDGDMIVAPVEGSNVTIDFRPDGTVGGNASCNMFGGGYTVEDDALTFSELVSTLMACAETEKMDQETAFLAALNAVDRYAIENGELVLYHGETGELRFSPVGDPLAPNEA